MKNTARALLCLTLSALFLSGCWQMDLDEDVNLLPPEEILEAEPMPAVQLPQVFALPYAPGRSLDPIECPDGAQQTAASLLCQGLFRLNGAFEPEYALCESYTYDPDSYTYVFTLREGAVFSDGSPVTAADARSSLERARQSERYGSRLSGISSLSAGNGTVTIRLSSPNARFPALLDVPIMKSGAQDFPVGTGPYALTQAEGALSLTANPYWQGTLPVDRIALVEAADEDAARYRFTSYEVQLITADLTGVSPFTPTGRVSYQDAATTVMQYIGCNTAVPPLDSAALRRALNLGVNREYVAEAFLSGHAAPAQFPVSPRSSLYPADLEARYSSEAFAQALAQSGYEPDRPLTLLVNEENAFKIAVAESLAESFTAAGVPVETRILPWAEYLLALETGDFDLYYGEVRLGADWDLSPLLSAGGALNYGGWENATMEELMAAYAEDSGAMTNLCRYLRQLAPILPLCFKSVSVLTQAEVVEGLSPTAAEPLYNLNECVIHLK